MTIPKSCEFCGGVELVLKEKKTVITTVPIYGGEACYGISRDNVEQVEERHIVCKKCGHTSPYIEEQQSFGESKLAKLYGSRIRPIPGTVIDPGYHMNFEDVEARVLANLTIQGETEATEGKSLHDIAVNGSQTGRYYPNKQEEDI